MKPFDDIPMAHVMAFDAVSALAYVGVAAGHRIDCTLDGDPDMQIVILAKDRETLQRFHRHIGIALDITKVQAVAMASTKTLRIMPIVKMQPKPEDDEL